MMCRTPRDLGGIARCQFPFVEPEIVLETDANMSSHCRCLRRNLHLAAAGGQHGPSVMAQLIMTLPAISCLLFACGATSPVGPQRLSSNLANARHRPDARLQFSIARWIRADDRAGRVFASSDIECVETAESA